ncbi:MAG: glycosyltransferase [bacterium]
MKILFISNTYKAGEPARGFCYSYLNYYPSLTKMDNARHQIIYFPVDENVMKEGLEAAKEKLIEIVNREKPALIFYDEGELGNDGLAKMKTAAEKVGAKTFFWACDDNWAFDTASKQFFPYFHWIATMDSLAPPKYKKLGFKNIIHAQCACNHFDFKPPSQGLPKIYDVTFVGQPHGQRRKKIEQLKKIGIKVNCWGYGWPAGVVDFKEMLRIIYQSKINLNFTECSGTLTKRLASIFLRRAGERNRKIFVNNPKGWSNNVKSFCGSFRPQIKGRNFEIPACRSFLLTEYADNLKDYYDIGREIACFDGIKDCAKKIGYYLARDKEREEIAKAGYERTIRDHTYEKRFNEIFKAIGLSAD